MQKTVSPKLSTARLFQALVLVFLVIPFGKTAFAQTSQSSKAIAPALNFLGAPENQSDEFLNSLDAPTEEEDLSAGEFEFNPDAHNASFNAAPPAGGMNYPANATFDLTQFAGKATYTAFLKAKVKPVLDFYNATGFNNVGAATYQANEAFLDQKTLLGYQGRKWNKTTRTYSQPLPESDIVKVFEALKVARPKSTVDTMTYYDKDDKDWAKKNDMAIAVNAAQVKGDAFGLANLYALTTGIGVKVKLNESNYNYHVLYKDGKGNANQEVMSGRSFASSPMHGAADASDPEYLSALQNYLKSTPDQKPFYRALIMAIAACDTTNWDATKISAAGQSVLSDFLTVYTAEADRHLMVNLQPGNHPWEIDLAAVTFVSAVSAQSGKVVSGGNLVVADLGAWFAPSTHNVAGGPQRSGIGITRADRVKFQKAIHAYENSTATGKQLIASILAITGEPQSVDVIQSVFTYLSSARTPAAMGPTAAKLADLMATFIEQARKDADSIGTVVPSIR